MEVKTLISKKKITKSQLFQKSRLQGYLLVWCTSKPSRWKKTDQTSWSNPNQIFDCVVMFIVWAGLCLRSGVSMNIWLQSIMQMQSRNFFLKHFGSVLLTAPRFGYAMKFFKHLTITGTKVLHICEIFAAFTLNLYPISWWSNASLIFINTISTWPGRENFLWIMVTCFSILNTIQRNTFGFFSPV